MRTSGTITKVLFLDCDGVLNSGRDFQDGEIDPLNPGSCALLREVINETGCKIVISSVWRKYNGFAGRDRGWRKLIQTGVLSMDDLMQNFKTPVLPDGGRGLEIAEWFVWQKEFGYDLPDRYAIIDDDSDMLPEQLPFFVQTIFQKGGLQQAHADKLVELLGKK